MARRGRAALRAALLCAVAAVAAAKKATPWKEGAVKADVKYVKCGVCEATARELYRQTKTLREDALAAGKKVLPEEDILQLTDHICDPERDQGEWIARLDMQERDDGTIELVDMGDFGDCLSECRTMQKACEGVVEDAAVDIAELLYRGEAGRAAVTSALCRELTPACRKRAPKLAADRAPGPAFVPADPEERRLTKMMKNMQGMDGMPGMSMYSREELMERYGLGEEGEDGMGFGGAGYEDPYADPYGYSADPEGGADEPGASETFAAVGESLSQAYGAAKWAAGKLAGLFGGGGGGGDRADRAELRRALRR